MMSPASMRLGFFALAGSLKSRYLYFSLPLSSSIVNSWGRCLRRASVVLLSSRVAVKVSLPMVRVMSWVIFLSFPFVACAWMLISPVASCARAVACGPITVHMPRSADSASTAAGWVLVVLITVLSPSLARPLEVADRGIDHVYGALCLVQGIEKLGTP